MNKKRRANRIRLTGLFFLAAFLNLYLVQLACNLPHQAQRLLPAPASQDQHHSAAAEEQAPAHAHVKEHAHQENHSHSAADGEDCCKGKNYAPFVKAAPSVALLALDKAPLILPGAYFPMVMAFLHNGHILPFSHAPPDPPVPKIPDIRIFLHSLTI